MMGVVVEIWVWFVFVVIITILRIAYRIKELGSIKNLQLDDCLITIALLLYTVETVGTYRFQLATEYVARLEGSGQATPAIIVPIIESYYKYIIFVDQCKIATVWLIKICLLILYLRITKVLRTEHTILRLITVYVVLTWVALEILFYSAWCRPFSDYWSLHQGQCGFPSHHFIMEAVFNLTSDTAMLAVMLTISLRSSLPLRKKIYVCGVFSLGVFVIFCAAASKYIIFSKTSSLEWLIWYNRESATAMIVASIPMLSTPIRWVLSCVRDLSLRTFPSASSSLVPKRSMTDTEENTTVRSEITALTTIETSVERFKDGGEGGRLQRQDTVISLETPKDKEGVKLVSSWDSRVENVREIQWIAPWTSEENEMMERGDTYFSQKA